MDHSLTYRDGRLRNWGHRRRLREIGRAVAGLGLGPAPRYFDIGCSNGYVTARVAALVGAGEATGFDHSAKLVRSAAKAHPTIRFATLDLNVAPSAGVEQADLVTCFETLEHVGNPDAAVANIVARLAPGGAGLISVPIETGPIGLVKYVAKRATGYRLEEIGASEVGYLSDLVLGRRLGRHRPAGRAGFGTHFGFDHRELAERLGRTGLELRAWTAGTTRFFLLRRK